MGLYGFEGLSAVRASDYGIANFRFLWKLILLEGRANHIKITKFIRLFIHKNILLTLPQFIFGFYSFFSAQSIFDDWYVVLYNLIFTSATVSFVGIYDQDIRYLSPKISESDEYPEKPPVFDSIESPVDDSMITCSKIRILKLVKKNFQHFYYITKRRILFSNNSFFYEFIISNIQAASVTVISFFFFSSNTVINQRGDSPDIMMIGYLIYILLIGTHIIGMVMRAGNINWLTVLTAVLGSVLPYISLAIWYDYNDGMNIHGTHTFIPMIFNVRFYLIIGVCLGGVFYTELILMIISFWFKPTLSEYTRCIKKMKKVDDPLYFKKKIIQCIKELHDPIMKKNNRAKVRKLMRYLEN